MNYSLLNATWRVETMVGREQQLAAIKEAIYASPSGGGCHVVLIGGEGGIGKSRLLEEVQWRAGHSRARTSGADRRLLQHSEREDWTKLGQVVVSDVVDLMDIRLSAKTKLLQALRDALSAQNGMDFHEFEKAMRGYTRALADSAAFNIISDHAKKVEDAFWAAFQEQPQPQRIVLMLDTAERLVLRSSDWLLKHKLLREEELVLLSSQQWLLQQIKLGKFFNTTLIIAGRDADNEGGPFFAELRSGLASKKEEFAFTELTLGALSLDETQQYFAYAAAEWRDRVNTLSTSGERSHRSDYERVAQTMEDIAHDAGDISVLHAVTGGKPVLLSLYGDLIHEPDEAPALLYASQAEIEQLVQERGSQDLQAEIERSFLLLFFQKPGLRSDIMQALARCPAGLDAEQLHFLLDGEEEDPTAWEPDPARLKEIRTQLEEIRLLSIARPRPDGRLGLQDEIYRIYAQRMSDTDKLRTKERDQRQVQYRKLSNWASQRLAELTAERREYQESDQRNLVLAINSPAVALNPRVPIITAMQEEERAALLQEIRNWEMERLHYDLLRDPDRGLNDNYTDLAEGSLRANIEELEFITQQEMWRVFGDRYALRFTLLSDDQIAKLRRAAYEEDPTRWLKRFVTRRNLNRAVAFWADVEAAIAQEPIGEQRTWLHPINQGERLIWKCYAQILLGKDVEPALVDAKTTLQVLGRLARARMDEPVGPKGETGFVGHAALPRLHRIIAVGYNFTGYGHVVLSKFLQGVTYYDKALHYTRLTKFEAQQAITRNNLGRALAALGREERGLRICSDALEMARQLGAEIPIAYSLNTLALIGNGMQAVPTAWKEAAQAVQIFRRTRVTRGLGLALIQLGIGLRRLANSHSAAQAMDVTPEFLYATAQTALGEAVDIFKDDPEQLRLIEALIEYGCVMRDQMRLASVKSVPKLMARFHRDAESLFLRAIALAEELGFNHLALQAKVDLAWNHFYAGILPEAATAGDNAAGGIAAGFKIMDKHFPDTDADESYQFYQLAKLQGLYAAVAMRRFEARREELRSQCAHADFYRELATDQEAQTQIAAAAKAFTLSLAYGNLYSPRSRSLVITHDQLYGHVKKLNAVEYRMFRVAQDEAQKEELPPAVEGQDSPSYRRRGYDFSDLRAWLDDCFGPLEVNDD